MSLGKGHIFLAFLFFSAQILFAQKESADSSFLKNDVVLTSDQISSNPTFNLENLLIGRVNGVEIFTSDGAIGGGYRYRFRGISSLTMPTEPLLVLDGVFLDNSNRHALSGITGGNYTTGNSSFGMENGTRGLSTLNPNDIESIEFLKSGAATAIYGSRGAMGAIVVKTKKGQKERVSVEYAMTTGFSEVARNVPKLKTTWSASEIETWASLINPNKLLYTDANITQYKQNKLVDYSLEPFRLGSDFGHSLRLLGGKDIFSYVVSGNFQKNIGHIKGTNFNAKGAFAGLTFRPHKNINIAINANYQENKRTQVQSGAPATYVFNRWGTDALAMPFMRYDDIKIPFAGMKSVDDYSSINKNSAAQRSIYWGNLQYHVVENLELNLSGGIDQTKNIGTAIYPLGFSGIIGNGRLDIDNETITQKTFTANLTHRWKMSPKIQEKTIVGIQFDDNKRNYKYGRWTNLIPNKPDNDSASYGVRSNVFFAIPYAKTFGMYFHESVNVNQKLYIAFGSRFDRSSTFVHSLAIYPYLLANYNFRKWLIFNVSMGSSGTQPAPYLSSTSYKAITTGYGGNGSSYVTNTAPIKNLLPERVIDIEAGFSLRTPNNRLKFDVSYYRRNFSDLLTYTSVNPALNLGLISNFANVGKMTNEGVETTVVAEALKTKNLSWNFTLNTYTLNNKVSKMGDYPSVLSGGFDNISQVREGYSVGAFWVGDPITAPADAPEKPLLANGPRRYWAGNSMPKLSSSLFSDFKYKWLNMSVLFDGKFGFYKYNQTERDLTNPLKRQHKDYWNLPTADLTAIYNDQSRWLQRADFWKLRQVALTLNMPTKNLAQLKYIKKLQVGFTATNLYTFTSYTGGYDVESETAGANTNGNSWTWERGIDAWSGGQPRSFNFSFVVGF